jgi:hypothetical protein
MKKGIDVKTLSDDQLVALIANHRVKGATDLPVYVEALAEQARRKHGGLDFATTIRVLTDAAKRGKFVSYKQLADASGVKWSKVHWSVGPHLDSFIEYCHRRGLPVLSAIVVNQENLNDGTLEPESLKGFVAGVRDVGISITDGGSYYREEQQRVFEWDKAQPEVKLA